jgi:N-acetylmuramoyl-L-alanine amidase
MAALLPLATLLQLTVAAPVPVPPPLVVRVDEARREVPVTVRGDGTRLVPLMALAEALEGRVVADGQSGLRWRLVVDSLGVDLEVGRPSAVAGPDTVLLPAPVERRADTVVVPEALALEVLPALGAGVVYDAAAQELLRIPLLSAPRVAPPSRAEAPPTRLAQEGMRQPVVVVDPGHGGRDAGMVGMRVNGRPLVEKQVTLAVALALREALEARGVRVVLTRHTDSLVPLAHRGRMANTVRGDLFISLHVNAASPEWSSPGGIRGFETYVLAEAQTADQRRLESLENAAVRFEGQPDGGEGGPLDFVMRDLEQNAHLRASADLAALLHGGMRDVHPGPSRGVQQAGFRVLRSAFMPAVLVELGYGTHPGDAAFLADPARQRDLAAALAEGTRRFLDRYPVTVGGR